MLCPTCQSSAQRSIVRVALIDGAALGVANVKRREPTDHYYDEDGVEHSHNPNVVVTIYMCSLGHRFQERSSWQCPCGWMVCEAEVAALA